MSRRLDELAFSARLRARLPRFRSIRDVAETMESIQELVGKEDGIWWFTELYRRVTVAVEEACQTTFFRYPDWMRLLVIEFAKLYFEALVAWFSGHRKACPPAWRVLFARRFLVRRRGYSPLQFALAGVNAHIQRDLSYAALRATNLYTKKRLTLAQVERDYTKVNRILEEVEVEAMRLMATGWIRSVANVVHPWDRRAAMLLIRLARQGAFWMARVLHRHEEGSPRLSASLKQLMEWYAWFWGRVVLLPSYSHGEW